MGVPRPPRDDDSEEEESQEAPRNARNKSSSTTSSSTAAVGVSGGQRIAPPTPVSELPVSIQRAFRIKMLSILLVQLLISLGVAFACRVTTTIDNSALNTTAIALNEEQTTGSTWLAIIMPPKTIQVLIFGMVMIIALPMLGSIKDKHPWNLVGTTIWSVLWGIFMAAASLPGGLVKSNSMFVLFGSSALGVFVLLFCSQLTVTNERGEKELWSFNSAGTLAWIIMVSVSFVVFSQTGHLYEHVLHFIMVRIHAIRACIGIPPAPPTCATHRTLLPSASHPPPAPPCSCCCALTSATHREPIRASR